MKPPISDPFELPLSAQSRKIFRVDLIRSFIGYFCLEFLIFGALAAILFPVFPRHRVTSGIIETAILFSIVIFGAMVATAVGFLYPVEVKTNGLSGNSFWGLKREVEWSGITRTRFAWFVFPYTILSTSRKRNFIWLPLYLRDMNAFARAVEESAPADNPLRLFLQKRGF